MPVKAPFVGELDLQFFPSANFESIEGIGSAEQIPIIARNSLRLLMMGWPESWQELMSWTTFNAVFLHRDPVLLKEMRVSFQEGFHHLFTQLEGKQFTANQHEQIQLYLSNCLSILPYGDITPYESFTIPQFVDGEWTMVDYKVEPIELTEKSGYGRFILQDKDRVFAYGLEPIQNSKAESHLIFMGTTYPAGQGFVPQVTTDLKGFETAGKTLYDSGRQRLHDWLLRQGDKAHVCGVSLGGSLSLLLAIDLGEHLSRVDALNPAGLHDPWYSKSRFDNWDEMLSKPRVVVQSQGNDPVSPFGVWKNDWDILKIEPPQHKQGPNSYFDHCLNYAGIANTTFVYIDAEEDNVTRKARNIWLYSLGRSLIYYPILVPYNYLIRPVLYWMWEHKVISLIALLALAALVTVGALGFISALAVAAIASTAFAITCLINISLAVAMPENLSIAEDYATLHDPALPRNSSMDIYSPANEIEVKMTLKEVNTYYSAMRAMKGKQFFPTANEPVKNLGGMTKRDLLKASCDPQRADEEVTLHTTKAKAVLFKRSLYFVNKLGTENEAELHTALKNNYEQYSVGKQA